MLAQHNGLNIVRLTLVLSVLLSHSYTVGRYGQSPILLENTPGRWALIGLFAVSGYLISSGGVRREYSSFVWTRVVRLWPAFIVCILVIAVVIAPAGYVILHGSIDGYLTADRGPLAFISKNALLEIRQSTISGTPDQFGWSGSLWTVIYTVVSYLIVGALLQIRQQTLRTVVIAAAFVLAVTLYANVDALMPYLQDARTEQLLRFLPLFLGGSLYFHFRHVLPLRWWAALCCLPVVLGLAALSPAWGLQLAAPVVTYILLTLANGFRGPRFFRRNDFALGFFYYSFAVQKLLTLAGVNTLAGNVWGYFAASVVCTLPLAAASWFFVEKPVISKRRAAADRKEAQHTPVPAPTP